MYELPNTTFETSKRETPWEIVSKKPVKPSKFEKIPDVLEALKADPNIRLYDYDINAPETLQAIRRTIKRMRQLPPKEQEEYKRWRFEIAPPEMKKLFEKELK